MATKKVKKFGRGGDILTALGAGLVGKALYDRYKEGKDDIKSDGRSSGLTRLPDTSEEKPSKKAEPVAVETEGERSAKAVSQGRPEMGDITSEMTSDVAAKRKGFRKSRNIPTDTTTTPPPPSPAAKATDKVDTGYENLNTLPAPTSKKTSHEEYLSKKAGLSGKGITTSGDPNKKVSKNKGRSEDPNRNRSTVRSDKDKMRERALEVQRRREEAEKSRYKKGGAVKSASSRADGIAIRGKTRGKVY